MQMLRFVMLTFDQLTISCKDHWDVNSIHFQWDVILNTNEQQPLEFI